MAIDIDIRENCHVWKTQTAFSLRQNMDLTLLHEWESVL